MLTKEAVMEIKSQGRQHCRPDKTRFSQLRRVSAARQVAFDPPIEAMSG